MRAFGMACFLVAGCSTTGLPGAGDGGPDNDGSVAADLRGASCGDVSLAVSQWLDAHRTCQVDADCTSLSTACGLDGSCGIYVNTGAPGPYFSSLLDAWQAGTCGAGKCTPCALWPNGMPGCVMGVCAAKAVGPGAVGDACVSGAQCATGECYSFAQSKMFTGGYCTVIDCGPNAPCPTGSTCRVVDTGTSICLQDCDPSLNVQQCRTGEMYACCSGPGPAGHAGWCSPNDSSLCTAK